MAGGADLPAAAREHGRRHPGHLRRVDHGLPADRRASSSTDGQRLRDFFTRTGGAYIVGESIFIIVFTYFYTAVTFNPVDQADNLKKYGGLHPRGAARAPDRGVPGPRSSRADVPGGAVPRAVAALPTILINQTAANFFFGGTSILIVVGVALDTMKQLEAQLMMRNYEGFLK
jgi:preprotein translocase subunit SecY